MDINQNNINSFLNTYIGFVDNLSKEKQYHPNIKHLLYLIVPAFVIKYGVKNERLILKCFSDTDVYVTNKKEKYIQAYFARRLKNVSQGCNELYFAEKYIVLNNFDTIFYTDMIDSIIHEFNHAINSMNNEIVYDDKYISLRTGLSYVKYSKSNLNFAIEKDENAVLEEIINTKQAEEVFNIIISLSNYNIENLELSNMINTLKQEYGNKNYESDAYYLQSYICKTLMKNKTFVPTIENLRLMGEVIDVDKWFDNIIGEAGTYKKMIHLLNQIIDLEKKYNETKWFKNQKLRRIKEKGKNIINIIKRFDDACVYK